MEALDSLPYSTQPPPAVTLTSFGGPVSRQPYMLALWAGTLTAAVAFAWSCFVREQQLSWPAPTAAEGVLWLLLLTAAATDLRTRKIYNWCTYPAMLWAVLLAVLVDLASVLPLESVAAEAGLLTSLSVMASLGGLFGCGALMLVPYVLSRGGAGDVKLAAAMGALMGFEAGLWSLAIGYVAAATFTAISALLLGLVGRRDLLVGLARRVGHALAPTLVLAASETQLNELRRPIPLAGFFAFGAAWVSFL